jgi:hypothetical protein
MKPLAPINTTGLPPVFWLALRSSVLPGTAIIKSHTGLYTFVNLRYMALSPSGLLSLAPVRNGPALLLG